MTIPSSRPAPDPSSTEPPQPRRRAPRDAEAPAEPRAAPARPAPSELLAEVERLRRRLFEAEAEIARLATLSEQDPLSGVLNRRGFGRELDRAASHAGRYGTAIALLLVDLDGFKMINDEQGHAAGDKVIVEVGAALRRLTRASDVVGRVGGDEFAVILWEVSPAEAALVARRLADALPAAASIGAAELGSDKDEALAAADRALYARKRERTVTR